MAVPASPSGYIPLPHLVYRRIAFFLSDDLATLLSVSSLSLDLRETCRPHISSFFRTVNSPIPPLSADYYYHSLLELVLGGYLDPSSIFEFYCLNFESKGPTDQEVYASDGAFEEAVRASPYIPADLVSEVCTRFRHGYPDAALVVLLPLCTRLKMLEVPEGADLCAAMFQSIAREHQQRGTNPEEARQKANEAAFRDRLGKPWRKHLSDDSPRPLPFSELLVLYTRDSPQGDSFSLIDVIPYMGIPSLQRITLTSPRDQTMADWPSGDIMCSCPEIYLQQAMVTKQAILAFAQGLTGPCEIRHWYQRDLHFLTGGPDDPTWDRVLIKRGPEGSKEIEIRLDYAGGNPGYDHEWVSWLYRGMMRDWTRLDEEFAFGEDDHENDWLGGMLV